MLNHKSNREDLPTYLGTNKVILITLPRLADRDRVTSSPAMMALRPGGDVIDKCVAIILGRHSFFRFARNSYDNKQLHAGGD